jgi:hypothetical protein
VKPYLKVTASPTPAATMEAECTMVRGFARAIVHCSGQRDGGSGSATVFFFGILTAAAGPPKNF